METQKIQVNKPPILQVDATRRFSLNLNVTRYTTDVNGTILADGAIPASQKTPMPFHLFGEFDRNGGFEIADKLLSPVWNTKLFSVYVWGLNSPLFFFNALADINNKFRKGDMLFVYVDDINAPNYFTFVIVSAQQGAYASLVGQLNTTQLDAQRWGTFKIFNIDYTWINDAQLDNAVYIIESRFDCSFRSDPLQPRAYYHVQYKPGVNKIQIPINAIGNQNFGLSSFMAYENSVLNLSFIVYA